MDLDDYQQKALATDQRAQGTDSLVIPLLGLAGEAGALLGEYKKRLRDGASHTSYESLVAEELGDILWYTSNLASKFGLSLAEIAEANLSKVADRWLPERRSCPILFDAACPPSEQLPRTFVASFTQDFVDGRVRVTVRVGDRQFGEPLTDAAPVSDGYRFHDILHLAFATFLAWSPVTRRNVGRKRRSDAYVDETQDGGRAIVIEEAVAAHVYGYARRHNLLDGIAHVDYSTLTTIKDLTAPFEVACRSVGEWQVAIIEGLRVFRLLIHHKGGIVRGDMCNRRFDFEPIG